MVALYSFNTVYSHLYTALFPSPNSLGAETLPHMAHNRILFQLQGCKSQRRCSGKTLFCWIALRSLLHVLRLDPESDLDSEVTEDTKPLCKKQVIAEVLIGLVSVLLLVRVGERDVNPPPQDVGHGDKQHEYLGGREWS